MPTNWQAVAEELAGDLPSVTNRNRAREVLTLVEQLGPLDAPVDEFRRVYEFLRWNEPARVIAVVEELLQTLKRSEQPWIKNNAWRYVVGAFDSWICRARVFYLAAGIVEGALKARVDERLTELFGSSWPGNPEAVPSNVRERINEGRSKDAMEAVRRCLELSESGDGRILDEIARISREATTPREVQSGSKFISKLDFGLLRSFFQAKRLWGGVVKLQSIFSTSTGDPPLKSHVDETLDRIHQLRNEVAHYRPSGRLNFSDGLFACAKIARWLREDLQHIYESIDTRSSTELSMLLESYHLPLYQQSLARRAGCVTDGCALGRPWDILLDRAPTDWPDEGLERTVLACQYHRFEIRAKKHRPGEE